MELSEFDLSVIYIRKDGSFVIDQGAYHVPNEGEWAGLWGEVSAYAAEHPEAIQPEPEPETIMIEPPAPSAEDRLADIEDALVELASIITGGE
jgi:hypothetical protein